MHFATVIYSDDVPGAGNHTCGLKNSSVSHQCNEILAGMLAAGQASVRPLATMVNAMTVRRSKKKACCGTQCAVVFAATVVETQHAATIRLLCFAAKCRRSDRHVGSNGSSQHLHSFGTVMTVVLGCLIQAFGQHPCHVCRYDAR